MLSALKNKKMHCLASACFLAGAFLTVPSWAQMGAPGGNQGGSSLLPPPTLGLGSGSLSGVGGNGSLSGGGGNSGAPDCTSNVHPATYTIVAPEMQSIKSLIKGQPTITVGFRDDAYYNNSTSDACGGSIQSSGSNANFSGSYTVSGVVRNQQPNGPYVTGMVQVLDSKSDGTYYAVWAGSQIVNETAGSITVHLSKVQ